MSSLLGNEEVSGLGVDVGRMVEGGYLLILDCLTLSPMVADLALLGSFLAELVLGICCLSLSPMLADDQALLGSFLVELVLG